MGTLKWYKRDPRAALVGMMKLTLEEVGAYCMVLELIYVHDGALDDDDKYIAGVLRIDIRRWKRLRLRLLSLGKIYVNGPHLRNERADFEVDAVQHRVKVGADLARKRWATYNEIKDLRHGYPMLSTSTKKESLSANTVPFPKKTTDKERK